MGRTDEHCCWQTSRAGAGRRRVRVGTACCPWPAPGSSRRRSCPCAAARRRSPQAQSPARPVAPAAPAPMAPPAAPSRPAPRARWPLSRAEPPGAAGGVGGRRAAPCRREPRRAGQRPGRALVGSASGLRARTGGRGRRPGGVGAGAARKKRCASASPALGRRAGSNAISRASRSSASSLACAGPASARRVLVREQGLGDSATRGGPAARGGPARTRGPAADRLKAARHLQREAARAAVSAAGRPEAARLPEGCAQRRRGRGLEGDEVRQRIGAGPRARPRRAQRLEDLAELVEVGRARQPGAPQQQLCAPRARERAQGRCAVPERAAGVGVGTGPRTRHPVILAARALCCGAPA